MADEPDSLVPRLLREMRDGQARLDRKLDAVLEELHDMRPEAAADRARVAGTDHAIQAVQRRLIRTDERVADLAKEVEALKAARAV